MKKNFLSFLVGLIAMIGLSLSVSAMPEWDMESLAETPTWEAAGGFSVTNGATPIYIDSINYNGNATKVFAWYALPAGASSENPVPAVVLVHGGGGTASSSWVKRWTDAGYAAISIDTCGHTGDMGGSGRSAEQHAYHGPEGCAEENVRQIRAGAAIENQWAYHAVAAAIKANSFLRSFAEVDSDKIGITGISWGGYLTEIVAGTDDRFAFAVPVYGCGYLGDYNTILTSYLDNSTSAQAQSWKDNWDPSLYVGNIGIPTLFLTGNTDFAFPMDAHKATYSLIDDQYRYLTVKNPLNHSHNDGQTQNEILAFAESVVNSGTSLAKYVSGSISNRNASATFNKNVSSAKLVYTNDSGAWNERVWVETVATVSGATVSATVPVTAKEYYFNAYDGSGLISSSPYESLESSTSIISSAQRTILGNMVDGFKNLITYSGPSNYLFTYSDENKSDAKDLLNEACAAINSSNTTESEYVSLKSDIETASSAILGRSFPTVLGNLNTTLYGNTSTMRYTQASANYMTIQGGTQIILASRADLGYDVPVKSGRRAYVMDGSNNNTNRKLFSIPNSDLIANPNDTNYIYTVSFLQETKSPVLSISSVQWNGSKGNNEVFGITSDGTDIYIRCSNNTTGHTNENGYTSYKVKIVDNYDAGVWYDFMIAFDATTRRLHVFVNGAEVGGTLYFAGSKAGNDYANPNENDGYAGQMRVDWNLNNASSTMCICGFNLLNYDNIATKLNSINGIAVTVPTIYNGNEKYSYMYTLPSSHNSFALTCGSDDFSINAGSAYSTFSDEEKYSFLEFEADDGNITYKKDLACLVAPRVYEKSFDDDYESYAEGYNITSKLEDGYYLIGGNATIALEQDGNKYLFLDGSSSNRILYNQNILKNKAGVELIEFRLKINDLSSAQGNLKVYIQDRNGTKTPGMYLDGSGVLRVAGSSNQYIAPVVTGKWYNIKFVYNFNTRKYSVYVDEVLKQSNLDIPVDVRNIGRIQIDARNTGGIGIDDLCVRSTTSELLPYALNPNQLPATAVLTDTNGTAIDEIVNGDYISGKVIFYNGTKDTVSAKAILALYSRTELIKVNIKDIVIENDTKDEIKFVSEEFITVPETGDYTVSLMVWDNFDDINHLSEKCEKSNF